MGLFTVSQARKELAALRPLLDELVVVRADAVELAASLATGGEPTSLGGLPEWKAAEARLNELMTEVQEKQWALGLELTDGIACNGGDKDKCKIGRLVDNRPMTITRATEADMATLRSSLTSVVLPAWIKRCGEKCGETYNRLVAPITGVKYEPK